jgi:hypothetical protein
MMGWWAARGVSWSSGFALRASMIRSTDATASGSQTNGHVQLALLADARVRGASGRVI